MWLRKGNLRTETEFLLTATENNAIRTSNIEAKNDNPQQISKCALYGNRDETVNHIISEYRKLAQKEVQS